MNKTDDEPSNWITDSTGPATFGATHRKTKMRATLAADAAGVTVAFEHAIAEYASGHAAILAAEAWNFIGDVEAGLVEEPTDLEVDAREVGLGRLRLTGEDARTVVACHFNLDDPDLLYVAA